LYHYEMSGGCSRAEGFGKKSSITPQHVYKGVVRGGRERGIMGHDEDAQVQMKLKTQ